MLVVDGNFSQNGWVLAPSFRQRPRCKAAEELNRGVDRQWAVEVEFEPIAVKF